ncbi:SagB/ThcOx family dehydrogenase [Thermodesulfobacteriota bacterium]
MKKNTRCKLEILRRAVLLTILLILPGGFICATAKEPPEFINLPGVRHNGGITVEQALAKRRSVRHYRDDPLSLNEISQLLWSAQGVTDSRGFRTAPSAGALYPLEIYLVAGNVSTLSPGIYRYLAVEHTLAKISQGDKRTELSRAALNQSSVRNAPAVLVFCCIYERTTIKYGKRGIKYVHMEAGHAAQNVFLQAASLGLGTVVIGAFSDKKVKAVLNVKEDEMPLYLMPVGKPSSGK